MNRRHFAAMLAVLPGVRFLRTEYAPYGYIGEGDPVGQRVAYVTFKDRFGIATRRIDPDDLIAVDDVNGWVLYAYKCDVDGRDYLGWDGRGEVRIYWKAA